MRIRRTSVVLAAGCAALLLGACHRPTILGGKGPAPTGQVAATVGGREITVRELQAEMNGMSVSDPKQMKLAQQRALQLIVIRTLMAQAAHDQGLDKTPDFAIQKQRAIDSVLAQALEAKVAQSVPAPAPEEIDRYIADNPDTFKRKVFDVDQLRFARPTDPAVAKTVVAGLQPLNTLDEVSSYLTRQHITFTQAPASLDALTMDARLVDAITKLPPNDLFVIPSGDMVLVNGLKATRVLPLSDAEAKTYAGNLLKRRHAQEAVQAQIELTVSQAMKQVRFNPAYAPPPATAGATPAAPGTDEGPTPAANSPIKSVGAP